MLKRLLPLLLLLSGCGYHLAGQGDDSVIGPQVRLVSVQSVGVSNAMQAAFKSHLMRSYGRQLTLIESEQNVVDSAAYVRIRLNKGREKFVPSSYDRSGVASQYELTVMGSVSLFQNEELVWESGEIEESGDVYVAGGPSGIEAAKERLLKELHDAWAIRAVQRLRSGF